MLSARPVAAAASVGGAMIAEDIAYGLFLKSVNVGFRFPILQRGNRVSAKVIVPALAVGGGIVKGILNRHPQNTVYGPFLRPCGGAILRRFPHGANISLAGRDYGCGKNCLLASRAE